MQSFYPLMLNTAKRSRTTVEALEMQAVTATPQSTRKSKKIKLVILVACQTMIFSSWQLRCSFGLLLPS